MFGYPSAESTWIVGVVVVVVVCSTSDSIVPGAASVDIVLSTKMFHRSTTNSMLVDGPLSLVVEFKTRKSFVSFVYIYIFRFVESISLLFQLIHSFVPPMICLIITRVSIGFAPFVPSHFLAIRRADISPHSRSLQFAAWMSFLILHFTFNAKAYLRINVAQPATHRSRGKE